MGKKPKLVTLEPNCYERLQALTAEKTLNYYVHGGLSCYDLIEVAEQTTIRAGTEYEYLREMGGVL
jgi:hypothetical protein